MLATSVRDSGRAEWRATADRLVSEFAALQAHQATLSTAVRELLTAMAGEPPAPNGPIAHLDLPALLGVYERSLVLWALAKTGGRQLDAARLLGVQPSTLNEKMKRLGIARARQTAGVQAAADPLRRRMA